MRGGGCPQGQGGGAALGERPVALAAGLGDCAAAADQGGPAVQAAEATGVPGVVQEAGHGGPAAHHDADPDRPALAPALLGGLPGVLDRHPGLVLLGAPGTNRQIQGQELPPRGYCRPPARGARTPAPRPPPGTGPLPLQGAPRVRPRCQDHQPHVQALHAVLPAGRAFLQVPGCQGRLAVGRVQQLLGQFARADHGPVCCV